MDVIPVTLVILCITNPMVGESALPDFTLATKDFAECVRVATLDELNGVFESDVAGWSEQKMNVLGHEDEGMYLKAAFPSVAIECLQEQAYVILDYEQSATLPGRECYEVSSGRRKASAGLQEQTSAAKAAIFA